MKAKHASVDPFNALKKHVVDNGAAKGFFPDLNPFVHLQPDHVELQAQDLLDVLGVVTQEEPRIVGFVHRHVVHFFELAQFFPFELNLLGRKV